MLAAALAGLSVDLPLTGFQGAPRLVARRFLDPQTIGEWLILFLTLTRWRSRWRCCGRSRRPFSPASSSWSGDLSMIIQVRCTLSLSNAERKTKCDNHDRP